MLSLFFRYPLVKRGILLMKNFIRKKMHFRLVAGQKKYQILFLQHQVAYIDPVNSPRLIIMVMAEQDNLYLLTTPGGIDAPGLSSSFRSAQYRYAMT